MRQADYLVSCDWGTSNFRLRLYGRAQGEVLDELREPVGIKQLRRSSLTASPGSGEVDDRFGSFLLEKTGLLLSRCNVVANRIPVVLSGMASSSVGWHELPYATVPFPLSGETLPYRHMELETATGTGLDVYLVSGVRTETDIMRGEETELLGLFHSPYWPAGEEETAVLLPGTHSKHAVVGKGTLRSFATYLTGELFDVLAEHSLLTHTLASENVRQQPFDPRIPEHMEAYEAGLKQSQETHLLSALFQTRSRVVLGKAPVATNHWFLRGLLHGTEIRDLLRRHPGGPIVVAGGGQTASAYRRALKFNGAGARLHEIPANILETAAVRGQAAWLNHAISSKAS